MPFFFSLFTQLSIETPFLFIFFFSRWLRTVERRCVTLDYIELRARGAKCAFRTTFGRLDCAGATDLALLHLERVDRQCVDEYGGFPDGPRRRFIENPSES